MPTPENDHSFGLRHVGVSYGSRVAVDDVSVTFGPGVTVLLGPNGAGKSTLFRVLTTFAPARSGDVVVNGHIVSSHPQRREYRQTLGWLPQDSALPRYMSVEDAVAYAGWLKRIPNRDLSQRVMAALERTNLTDRRADRVSKLSGGMLRRLGIAQAIVHTPRFIVLDEPTAGLDPVQRESLYRTIVESARESTAAVVVSTHLLEDVAAIAHRVVVMDRGAVKFAGPTEAFVDAGDESVREPLKRMRSAFMRLIDHDD